MIGRMNVGIIANKKDEAKEILLRKSLEGYIFSGIFCVEEKNSNTHPSVLPLFDSFEELCQQVDILYILSKNTSAFEYALHAIRKGKHVCIEDLTTLSFGMLDELLNNTKEANVACLVGNSYLNNPLLQQIIALHIVPHWIDYKLTINANEFSSEEKLRKRLQESLYIILSVLPGDNKKLSVHTYSIFSQPYDSLHIRIENTDGSIANIQLQACMLTKQHDLQIFANRRITSINFLENEYQIEENMDGDHRIQKFHVNPKENNIHNYFDLPLLQLLQYTNHGDADKTIMLRKAIDLEELTGRILKKLESFLEI